MLGGLLLPGLVVAQGTSPSRSIAPYASAQLTLTDNFELGATQKSADSVLRLTAGAKAQARSGRVQGTLDYSLSALAYARHSDRNGIQHQLAADVDVEWYERQGFLRAGATVQQVARSAFDAPVRSDNLPGLNSTDLRSVRLAPRWQGLLPGGLQIRAQAEASVADAADSRVGDTQSTSLSVRVAPFRPAPLSWAIDLVHLDSDFDLARRSRSTRVFGSLIWTLTDLDLQFNARAGAERSNIVTLQARDDSIWGMGLQWQPSPRTRVSADLDERGFGRSHRLSGEYRTPRTVWQLGSSRGVQTGGSTLEIGQRGRAFDILFASFASIEPDFAKRVGLVDAELARLGLRPTDLLFTTFLRSALTIDDRNDFSVGWRAPRITVLFNHSRGLSRRADTLVGRQDDLGRSSKVRQMTNTLALSYRLTPESYANLTATTQSGVGDLATQRSRQNGLSLQWGGRFTPDDSWSIALRTNRYSSAVAPYSENAIVATYGRQF